MLGEVAVPVVICGITSWSHAVPSRSDREHGEHGVAGKQVCRCGASAGSGDRGIDVGGSR
ncbi:hypothetical protein T261_02362 [Streptomyces lydicus]|nr:hypothetical protein T261_02362 [Streptomyces lydicus]